MPIKTQTNVTVLGIDVAKDKLDIWFSHSAKHQIIQNNTKAIQDFIEELREQNISVRLAVMEATGGYEKKAALLFQQKEVPLHVANPSQVYHFKQSKRVFAKTDRIDAEVLATFGEQEELTPNKLIQPEEEALKELGRRKQQLTQWLIAEKMRLKDHLAEDTRESIKRMVEQLEKEIKAIEEGLAKHIAACPQKSMRANRLQTFKGIGKNTAELLVTALPELGCLTRAEISALVGVAPRNKDSGKKEGYRTIHGGRFHIRRAIYMNALTAIRHNATMRSFYDALSTRKKSEGGIDSCYAQNNHNP